MKDRMTQKLKNSDDYETGSSLIRAINSAIDNPPKDLKSMSYDDLGKFIVTESNRLGGVGEPDIFSLFSLPGNILMEFPAQALKHGEWY